MRKLALLAPLLLAACVSEQQRCVSSVSREFRTVNALIQQTRANIQRGYGIAEREEVRTRNRRCTRELDSGEQISFPCPQTYTVTRRVPVTLNLAEERIKLRQLEARAAPLRAQAEQQIATCRAAYPEA